MGPLTVLAVAKEGAWPDRLQALARRASAPLAVTRIKNNPIKALAGGAATTCVPVADVVTAPAVTVATSTSQAAQ